MFAGVGHLRPYLTSFDLRGLFVEGLGWDHPGSGEVSVRRDGCNYVLTPLAEKSDFAVFKCDPGADGEIPPYPMRRKIETGVVRVAYEHLILFVNASRSELILQWIKRTPGAPPACREFPFRAGQPGDFLLQRLATIAFELEEQEDLGIGEVVRRVQRALHAEKVTKAFYSRFRCELETFQGFIRGIRSKSDRAWYASLMLNRMMFIYFIQKQSFLDRDPHYLRNRLEKVRESRGPGQFHGFYRLFLRRLFHEGLGQPEAQRAPELADLLGAVPFLNGGLFELHDLERDNPDLEIPDEAFERVFGFFDQYRWHLDERPKQADNEINPDVLGYIFENYINQKQMGAYYTKEDITGYITRNTLIPFLFQAAEKTCRVAFQPGGGVWRLLRDDPDRYIYPAMAHGVAWRSAADAEPHRLEQEVPLPPEIAAGLEDPSQRESWNKRADDPAVALPTETWREVIGRRRRYQQIRARLASGEVADVDECVTLNLDLGRFTRDVIIESEGPELVRAFWQATRDASVLDPTCGSGAFLFAALNVLEPLYLAALEGMRGFLHDLELSGKPHRPEKLGDFREVLDRVEEHPSTRYFILKSIVLNNLYGVDIMEEAVEICKLRLFLKLVAQLRTYDEIEPVPDIDFNIRTGNTLVGFTSLKAVQVAMTRTPNGAVRLPFPEEKRALARIEEKAEIASRAFLQFREQQTALGGSVTAHDKAELRAKLVLLREELDALLGKEYGSGAKNRPAYEDWRARHQPFHWFVEFYGIMARGGFDVIVGNPPYINVKEIRKSYATRGFATSGCSDIYAQVVERAVHTCRTGGRTGMIVPLSLTFRRDFSPLRELLYRECDLNWFSSFGRIPSALFSFDIRVRNTIHLGHKFRSERHSNMTTRLHRWNEVQRPSLFETLSYSRFNPAAFRGLVPKIGSAALLQSFQSLVKKGCRLKDELSASQGNPVLHYKPTPYNWLTFCPELPPAYGPDGSPVLQSQDGTVKFGSRESRDLSLLLANGKLMFVWWAGLGDDFHLTQSVFASLPFGPTQLTQHQKRDLLSAAPELLEAMAENIVFKKNAGKQIGNFNLARCRHLTDVTDRIWLDAVGLSNLWEEVELEHSLVVRTSFEDGPT